ncbi:MAG: hypothetical protein NC320_01720 [Clostridium sp.]|nr:hypothetical protein [Clostridium sp.]
MSNSKKNSSNYIKTRTNELYDSLPHEKEERIRCLSIRDEIIELNYTFFGYVAASTFVENTTHEDKFQTALLSFMGMWWKYKWTPKYRADLSFAVFFKPRLSEEIRRNLSTVSYTSRRTLCMKAAEQLGKNWTAVTYDDLTNVTLSSNDMNALKSILGASYPADISDAELYLEAPNNHHSIEDYQTTMYDLIEELLIQEMIEQESPLSDRDLRHLSDLYTIDYDVLKSTLPKALKILHKRLTENL